MTGGFPSQRASEAENVSIRWRHNVIFLGKIKLRVSSRVLQTFVVIGWKPCKEQKVRRLCKGFMNNGCLWRAVLHRLDLGWHVGCWNSEINITVTRTKFDEGINEICSNVSSLRCFLYISPWLHFFNKTFRELQYPRPANIRKCEHWLSMAISNSDPLHGTLHHATLNPYRVKAATSSLKPDPGVSWQISKFRQWNAQKLVEHGRFK